MKLHYYRRAMHPQSGESPARSVLAWFLHRRRIFPSRLTETRVETGARIVIIAP